MGHFCSKSWWGTAASAVTVGALVGCGGGVGGAEPAGGGTGGQEADLYGAQITTGEQRSAIAYGEAVVLEPDDPSTEACAGVLVAPRVILTAAHCVAFVPRKTWKVTAPFTTTGTQTRTARDGEAMDAAFKNATREGYADKSLRDVAVVYLDTPFENATKAVVSATGFPTDPGFMPTFVSSVGRAVDPAASAPLVLSGTGTLAAGARAAIEYGTPRLTATGQSGGPLFVEGTHKLVAVHAGDDGRGNDRWTRLDGEVYTWLTQKVASHGGWYNRD